MPPKKKGNQPSDKAKAKSKAKSAEDKTFGLKNKNKSKKVQQHINQIKASVDGGLAKKKEAEAKRKAEEKKAQEEAKREAAALFGIQQQKFHLELIQNLFFVNFSRMVFVLKETNVNLVMIQMLVEKLLKRIYILIVEKKKKKMILWIIGMKKN